MISVPAWSTLRTLGQSKLVSLTVIVPFLGSLIMFNQQLVDWLLPSREIVSRFMGLPVNDLVEATRHSFTMNRLYSAYFGLSLIGIASFIFIVLCPRIIKKYGSVEDYIVGQEPLTTEPRLRILQREVSEDFQKSIAPRSKLEARLPELTYPTALHVLFCAYVDKVFRELEGDEYNPEDVVSMLDIVIIENVSEKLQSGRRVDRGLIDGMAEKGMKHLKDILDINYTGRDYSRPLYRVIVSALYSLGFLILFIPTITTFYFILRLFVRSALG